MKLTHWVKDKESDEPYQFARFNRKAEVVTYTDDEYTQVIERINPNTVNTHA